MTKSKANRNGPIRSRTANADSNIMLSQRDSERVLKLLENPPKPTPALLAAARRYRARRVR